MSAPYRTGIDRHDLGILLLHSLRYSVGRMSTAPSTTSDLIRNYARAIPDADLGLILRDLREEIRLDRLSAAFGRSALGHDCDRRTWVELESWLSEHAAQRGVEAAL